MLDTSPFRDKDPDSAVPISRSKAIINKVDNKVIIGITYNERADIWSNACMIFEMLTGDFLFEPRRGPNFKKNDDHLA